ncbi:TPA: hypothetical protein ACGUWY_004339 [Vibrio vulnificus]
MSRLVRELKRSHEVTTGSVKKLPIPLCSGREQSTVKPIFIDDSGFGKYTFIKPNTFSEYWICKGGCGVRIKKPKRYCKKCKRQLMIA